jgi:DNA primase
MNREIELIKEKIDIVEYVGRSVPLKKAGRNYTGLCPFHQEHSPSFNVSNERGIFKCFGCGVSGDLFTFVIQKDGLSFNEALELLAKEAGVELPRDRVRKKEDTSLEDRLYAMHEVAAEYYHYLLAKHEVAEEARTYLTNRGVKISSDPAEIVEQFKIGYAPRSWDSLGTFLLNKKFTVEEIVAGGLGVKSENQRGFYDMFRGRVMFPLYSKTGRIVGFAGRVLGTDKTAKYINTAETVIFHKREFLYGFYQARESIRRSGAVILVEGEMDMLSSVQMGIKNVVAVKGSVLTVEQIEMLSKVCNKLMLCFDADFAGDKAMRAAIDLAETKEMEVSVIQLVDGKDPDECIRKNPESWKQSIENAVRFYDYLIQSSLKRNSSKDPYGQQKIVKEILPHISNIKNMVIKSHYFQKLGTILDIPEKTLQMWSRQGVGQLPIQAQKTVGLKTELVHNTSNPISAKDSGTTQLEKYVIALLLKLSEPVEGLEKKLKADDIDDKNMLLVYNSYVAFFDIQTGKTVKDFLESAALLDILPVIDELFLIDVPFESDDDLRKELLISIKKLKEIVIRRKLREISLEIKQFELQGDNLGEIGKLQKQVDVLLGRLAKLQQL